MKRKIILAFTGGLLIVLTFVIGMILPYEGIDWSQTYRPAALALLKGQNPFQAVPIYFAAPWVLIPLVPFALLPERLGRGAFFVVSLMGGAYTAKKMGAKPVALAAFIVSPVVMHGLYSGNVDWIALLGYVLPPPVGLLLVAIKPQVGIGAMVYWSIAIFLDKGIKGVVAAFTPLVGLVALSVIPFGFWFLRFGVALSQNADAWAYNQSFFPLSLSIGLALLVLAFRQRSVRPAMAASPCLSPYVLLHTWTGVLAAVVADTPVTVVFVIGLWAAMALRVWG